MKPYHKIQTIYKRDEKGKIQIGRFSIPEFEYLSENQWTFTEKVDGTNVRIVWDGNTVSIKGRTDRAQMQLDLVDRLNSILPTSLFEKEYPDIQMTLYGEGYGARIQKGGGNYISDGVDFILFDVYIGDIWLERENVNDIASHLGIGVVPIVGGGTLFDAVNLAEAGFESHVANSRMVAEGIVCRPGVELLNRAGHRIIAKIKHGDFK